jgi:hypothetical protein
MQCCCCGCMFTTRACAYDTLRTQQQQHTSHAASTALETHNSCMLVTCASAHQDLDVLEQCCCRSCCRCQAQHTHAPAMAGSTQNNPKAWSGNPNPLRSPLSTPHPSHQVDWSAAHINHTSACSIVNCSCVVGTTQHTRQRLAPCSCTVAASGVPRSPAATCSSPSPVYRCMLPPPWTPCPESLPHPQHLPETTLPTSLHACFLPYASPSPCTMPSPPSPRPPPTCRLAQLTKTQGALLQMPPLLAYAAAGLAPPAGGSFLGADLYLEEASVYIQVPTSAMTVPMRACGQQPQGSKQHIGACQSMHGGISD